MKVFSYLDIFKTNFLNKKYLFLFLSYVISGLCLLLFNFTLANTFSEYEFGLFATLYALSMVFSQVAHSGSPSLILNKYGMNTLYESKFLESLKKFLVINASVVCFLFIFFIPIIKKDISINYFLLFFPLILVQSLFELAITKFQINNKFNQLSLLNIIPNLARLILLILFSFISGFNNFIGFLQFYMLLNLLLILFLVRNQNLNLEFLFKLTKINVYLKDHFKILFSTIKFGLYEILFISYVQLPVVIVGLFYGFEEVAVVALSLTVVNIFLMPSVVFQKVYTPEIHLSASKGFNFHKAVNTRFTLAMLIMGFLMALLTYFFGSLLPFFFLDQTYSSSSVLIKILSLYVFFRFLISPNSISLLTLNHTKALNKIIIGVIIFQLILFSYFLNLDSFHLSFIAWIMISTEVLFLALLRVYLSKKVFT